VQDNWFKTESKEGFFVPLGTIGDASELGLALRHHRQAAGWTLSEAAALSGVGIRFLSELERGKKTASLGKTLQVLQRFGLDLWLRPRGGGRSKRRA